MTLSLTTDTLRAAYDYLATTPPFSRWNMPDGEDVRFVVGKDPTLRGWYVRRGGRHEIGISTTCIGRTESLMKTMAHEMVHLHQAEACMETKGEHNAAFQRLAERVCKAHGFDPKLF